MLSHQCPWQGWSGAETSSLPTRLPQDPRLWGCKTWVPNLAVTSTPALFPGQALRVSESLLPHPYIVLSTLHWRQ